MPIEPVPARVPEDLATLRTLFQEYADALGVDLCFQGFERELRELPGDYARPRGELLLALAAGAAAACVALRPLDATIAEMKRLYVRPAYRGTGLGRRMALAIVAAARERGYARLRLDTLPMMTEGIALYRSLGFTEIAPYRVNPVPGALFLELVLR